MSVWKDIDGYEGLYQVSIFGEVRNTKGRTRKGVLGGHGYLQIMLSKCGKTRTFLVHRLVAQAFIPNPDGLPEVNHKDENKQNNAVDNLEWCTPQYNMDYSNAKWVHQYDKQGNYIKSWKSTKEVERVLHISNGNISNCCNGRVKTAGGYVWRYAEN